MTTTSLAGRAAGVLLGLSLCLAHNLPAQTVTPHTLTGHIVIEAIQGVVEVAPAAPGAPQWARARVGQSLQPGDRVRTREFSRVTIRWSDRSVIRIGEKADFQIQAGAAPKDPSSFSLLSGILYFFNRDRLMNARYGTRTASAAIRGTEFVLQAEENGRTTLTVVEGDVDLSNDAGVLTLRTGEQGVAEPGQPPRKTPAIIINNIIQWALYYPAVLDVDEIGFTLAERERLRDTLLAYKSGDLLRALDVLPGRDAPLPAGASTAERIYRAGLLLAVGAVEQSEALLNTIGRVEALKSDQLQGQNVQPSLHASTLQPSNPSTPPEANAGGAIAEPDRPQRLADALRQLIAAVKLQERAASAPPELASKWLAESYWHQSKADLRSAIHAAKKSVEASADFGFGWARVAELEFSFGHTREALAALDRSLKYSPRNAQALTLKGFVLAAQNKIDAAIPWFHRAMEVDPALANAWLGRGLCLIRQGNLARGRDDLLIAAALEPQRAILRSYLAKAYTDSGDEVRAAHELKLAKALDENDPTAWLYSALLNEQQNRINEAVRDLEKSQELNDNRRIYRSGLLLDQDRAVRSANLARIYQDAGMFDVAVREAGRAVSYDYGNYSAHLFLANSYDQLLEPNRPNLRYETPAEGEYLIANLLAPVGAGVLAQSISQQEYSKLFERDRLGVASLTGFLSRGAWTQQGAQYGTLGNTAYALEAYYHTDPGQRSNNDFEERILALKIKQQLTPLDTVYAQAIYSESSGGDLLQRYDAGPSLGIEPVFDPTWPPLGFHFKENQDPILHVGYHREWSPGVHTLLLGSRLSDRFSAENLLHPSFFINRTNGVLGRVEPISIYTRYRSVLEIYSAEAQQIVERHRHTTIVGGRYQTGDFRTMNLQTHPIITEFLDFFDPNNPAAQQDIMTEFDRVSFYAYHNWQVFEPLILAGGVAYDWIRFPENLSAPPISEEQGDHGRFSPKAGMIWNLSSNTVARAAYSRSLSGVNLDQSARIEPTQVAGFNQAFRSIQPEAYGGSLIGARFTTYNVSLEQRLPTRTYLGLAAERLESKQSSPLGAFQVNFAGFVVPSSINENLDYREESLLFTVNQLVGDEWSFGARYRLTDARLDVAYDGIASDAALFGGFQPERSLASTLHHLNLHAIYNHASGFFARGDAIWYAQSNRGHSPDRPGDDFWQFNILAGVRLRGRSIELAAGILNLHGQNYRLDPLTVYSDLPRDRTLFTSLRLNF